jgi:hypothetical protein
VAGVNYFFRRIAAVSCPSLLRCVCPELRPLPSTGITRLHRYYKPLRHPRAPAPSLAGVRLLIAEHASGLPVLRALSLVYMLPPLPRRSDWDSICSITQRCQSSPLGSSGRSAHRHFRGLLARSLALRPAHSRRHRISRQLHRRLQLLRYLHSCSGSFWLEHLPGGAFTHWASTAFHGAHPNLPVVNVRYRGGYLG